MPEIQTLDLSITLYLAAGFAAAFAVIFLRRILIAVLSRSERRADASRGAGRSVGDGTDRVEPRLVSQGEFYDDGGIVRIRPASDEGAEGAGRRGFRFRTVVLAFLIGGVAGAFGWPAGAPLLGPYLTRGGETVGAFLDALQDATGEPSVPIAAKPRDAAPPDDGPEQATTDVATSESTPDDVTGAGGTGAGASGPAVDRKVRTVGPGSPVTPPEDTPPGGADDDSGSAAATADRGPAPDYALAPAPDPAPAAAPVAGGDPLQVFAELVKPSLPRIVSNSIELVDVAAQPKRIALVFRFSRALSERERSLFSLTSIDRTRHIICNLEENADMRKLVDDGFGLDVTYLDIVENTISRITLPGRLCSRSE